MGSFQSLTVMMLVTVGPYANFDGHMYKLQTTFWIYQKKQIFFICKVKSCVHYFLKTHYKSDLII